MKQISQILLIVLLILVQATAWAQDIEELELINRPVNVSGLTGLLFTTSPFTAPAGSVEATASLIQEKSDIPDYTFDEIPSVSLTVGLSRTVEVALKGSYVHETGADDIKKRAAGNTEFSYKWNFLPQTETAQVPALALTVTAIAGSPGNDITVEGVSHWGARAGLSAGREVDWGDHVVGIFADAAVAVNDLSKNESRDRYSILNTGLIIPISKYRNLQMMLEYSIVNGINRLKSGEDDYSAVAAGLRLVTERVNFTIGTQFRDKRTPGIDTANRMLGMAGVKF